jgi:hypothetical protein
MNVPTITMEPKAAQAKLEAYQAYLRRRADEEYQKAAEGYAALATGKPLLNLADAFTTAGLHQDGRPKLAIARADRRQVRMIWRQGAFWFNALKNPHQSNYSGDLIVIVPFDRPRSGWIEGYSLVPMVPADVRPPESLKNFFVLWEVEQWADRPLIAIPDRDPCLLRHLAGDLYIVEAEWDLTPLERAIMAGRREA